jgi:hypothetical protein
MRTACHTFYTQEEDPLSQRSWAKTKKITTYKNHKKAQTPKGEKKSSTHTLLTKPIRRPTKP